MTREAPTINEIFYQNIERIQAEQLKRMADVTGLTRFSRYHVNDLVQFDFNGLIRYGRITTVMNRAGLFSYNIDSGRTWYREVDESKINGMAAESRAITILR